MNYRAAYERRKREFLETPYKSIVGINAAWAVNYLRPFDYWYLPGSIRAGAHTASYDAYVKINYREENAEKFAADLIDAVKKDLEYQSALHDTATNKQVTDRVSDIPRDGFFEIAVYVYETQSFFPSVLGYRYRYLFIKQEPYLNFYTTLYDGTVYEGFKEEVVAVLRAKHDFVAEKSFYFNSAEL